MAGLIILGDAVPAGWFVGFGVEGILTGDLLAFGMTLSLAVMMVISRQHQYIPIMPAACISALLSGAVAIPLSHDLVVSG